MAGTWPEAVVLLHHLGWNGEMIDDACTALVDACAKGALEGRDVSDLTPSEARQVLAEPIRDDEAAALCRLAELRGQANPDGESLRAALRDLDAWVDALGEA